MSTLLRRVAVAELLGRRHQSIDAATRLAASAIVEDVRLRERYFGILLDITLGQQIILDPISNAFIRFDS